MYHSYNLIFDLLTSNPNNYSNLDFLVISLLLSVFITGIFAFPGFVFPTNRIIGKRYYELKNPDSIKKVYKLLGLRYFRKFLLLMFWGFKKNRKKYFSGQRSGFQNFIFQTKQSEFGHLGAFVLIFIVSVPLIIKGYLLLTFLMVIINIVGNGFPILLQRYHRARIKIILDKRK